MRVEYDVRHHSRLCEWHILHRPLLTACEVIFPNKGRFTYFIMVAMHHDLGVASVILPDFVTLVVEFQGHVYIYAPIP